MNKETLEFVHGVENLVDDELIHEDAASNAQNWFSQDAKLQLIPGKLLIGAAGVAGAITGEIMGFRPDGTKIHWRKAGTKIQYLVGSTWTDVITGLTQDADYAFSNYSSLAGDFTFATGVDGIFKMNNANPGSYLSLYNSFLNFKGLSFIDRGRMLMWNLATDKTGLYGSKIDPQDSDVYTSVTNEILGTGDGATKTFTGTLAYKSDPLSNAFGLIISGPTAAGTAITGISKASQAVITSVAHGLSVGDTVIVSGITSTIMDGTGTIDYDDVTSVVGTGTAFTTQLKVGGNIYVIVASHSVALQITNISDDTHLEVKRIYASGFTGLAFKFSNMGEINNMPLKVVGVPTADTATVSIDSTNFTMYQSGGTLTKAEVLTDNNNGALSSISGATGSINYITGAYSITFENAPQTGEFIFASYQHENSNNGGVTDFTHSADRIAGEGFVVRQDKGGDPILNVLVGPDGAYYSLKSTSSYRLEISADDTSIDNNIYREEIGIPSWRAGLSIDEGIVFMNTANPQKPEFTLLERNPIGNSVDPKTYFPEFKFANYNYDDCTLGSVERYVIIACKSQNATKNDTVLLCNLQAGTVDITNYQGRTFVKDSGLLYMGSSVTESVFNLFSGYDDDGFPISNFWISKGENYETSSLKKYRKIRLRGHITSTQSYAVYASYDDAGFQLVGTVTGKGSYVDYSTPQSVGSNQIGNTQIGGDVLSNVYAYSLEIRLKKVPKFRKRKLQFVALGYGYVDITYEMDWEISLYEDKIPGRFRQKQNVSLDGTATDLPNPQF